MYNHLTFCALGLGLWNRRLWAHTERPHRLCAGHLFWSDRQTTSIVLCRHDHQAVGFPKLWVHQNHAWYKSLSCLSLIMIYNFLNNFMFFNCFVALLNLKQSLLPLLKHHLISTSFTEWCWHSQHVPQCTDRSSLITINREGDIEFQGCLFWPHEFPLESDCELSMKEIECCVGALTKVHFSTEFAKQKKIR